MPHLSLFSYLTIFINRQPYFSSFYAVCLPLFRLSYKLLLQTTLPLLSLFILIRRGQNMSKTLKKDSGRLKFDTSLNNLKCFIRAQSIQKMGQAATSKVAVPSAGKMAMETKKKMEFQDKDFLSSVVCKVLNDANAQEITQLIDNMDFSTVSSEKELSLEAPGEEIEHLQMRQIFNAQDANKIAQNSADKKKPVTGQSCYFVQPQPTNTKSEFSAKTQESTFSDSLPPSPEQSAYPYYSSYNYPYVYYQNSAYQPKQRKGPQESSSYKIIPQKIQSDVRTTLMIRHIPNKYTEKMLKQQIQKLFKNRTNFLYLPVDDYNQCNVGYAFINFIDTKFIKEFYLTFSGRRWDMFNSQKKCELAYARIQGNSLISHFQNSPSYMKTRE